MSFFCKYNALFGLPGTGVHSYRIFDIAIVDVILTFVLAYIISIWFNYSLKNTIIILFMTGIIFHRLFCVRTTIDKLLFESY